MIDLTTLHTFTEQNGIYAGVNKPNFKSIELWLQTIKDNRGQASTRPNALGLFGPASTGKTSTAAVVAKNLNQPLININSASLNQASFWESIYLTAKQQFPQSFIYDIITPTASPKSYVFLLQRCVILLDECHEISNKTQGQMLSILDGSTNIVPSCIKKEYPLGFKDVTWVFSTTDSGKLLYPLSTRLHSVVLSEYSEQDVVEIVKLNYPVLPEDAALVLSRAAKLVPRIALDLTKQFISIFRNSYYTRESAMSYVKSIRQTNEYGLDNTDQKILDMLKTSKHSLSKVKQADKNLLSMKLDRFDLVDNPSEEQLTEAIKLQEAMKEYELEEEISPLMPRSRQDISTYCRLYDMRDLELRLGYMEKLGVIAKTKSGVVWKRDVE